MLKDLVGGLVKSMMSDEDKEKAVKKILNIAVKKSSEKYKCNEEEVMIMIMGEKNTKEGMNFSLHVFVKEGKTPKSVGIITVDEIISFWD